MAYPQLLLNAGFSDQSKSIKTWEQNDQSVFIIFVNSLSNIWDDDLGSGFIQLTNLFTYVYPGISTSKKTHVLLHKGCSYERVKTVLLCQTGHMDTTCSHCKLGRKSRSECATA